MSLANLPTEIIFEIFGFLRPLDLLNTRGLNKSFLLVSAIILQTNLKKTKVFDGVPPEIFSMLDENCLLSGSSVLQFLLGEVYEKSDFDLFVTKQKVQELTDVLFKHSFARRINFNENYPTNLRVIDFTRDQTKIQLVIVEDPLASISDFDFKIVKNVYDGNRFLTNYTCLSTKTEYLLSNCYYKEIRLNKYRSRGFTFIGHGLDSIDYDEV